MPRIEGSIVEEKLRMVPRILMNIDGGARRNPGPAAIGILIYDENRNELESYKECIGDATNNIAEYRALIKALELAAKYTRENVRIFMDSELVIRQVNGGYKVKKKHLSALYYRVKENEKPFAQVAYTHVSRDDPYQAKADQLVNEALDLG